MARSAAERARQAAATLDAYLRDRAGPQGRTGPEAEEEAEGAGPEVAVTAADGLAARASPAPSALDPDRRANTDRQAGASGPTGSIPLCLPQTDWLHHRLTVTGPPEAVAAFRVAAAGAGVVPWHLDGDRIEEDLFLRLATATPRTISLEGARILAAQLRAAMERRHALAVARVGQSRACPFDLHALVPVPAAVLRLGPDHPGALAWLWENWGTTETLRHVEADNHPNIASRRTAPSDGMGAFRASFWSADWSPWRALAHVANTWPALRFDLRPTYDDPG